MKITAVKQQVKRTDRYSIYVDGKYSFSLGQSQFVSSGLHSGLELTSDEINTFKNDSDIGKIYERTLNLLSYRPRSEWELRDYLRRKKQDPDIIELILNKLSINGHVNDQKFAERWVENRRLLKSTSRRKLQLELRQKRIPSDVIDKVLAADKEETDEQQVLRDLVARKSARYPDKLKFMQYLARQGYNYSDIKQVLDEVA
ncbi:MAG: RecX family transcriptional regulator [Candidatus Saccharimonadales bacterium]